MIKSKFAPIVFGALLLVVAAGLALSNNTQTESDVLGANSQDIEISENVEVATFAAGCFWCTEAVFQETPGVISAVSGYAGGTEPNPTYEEVYKNLTSHREAVQIVFDPAVVSYDELLTLLWQNIDPTDDGGQFVDRGFSYTTAIFYHDEVQANIANTSRSRLAASDKFSDPIVTPIEPFTTFYEAEEYHQDFYKKSTSRYKSYESNSGRSEYKAQVWSEIQSGAN